MQAYEYQKAHGLKSILSSLPCELMQLLLQHLSVW